MRILLVTYRYGRDIPGGGERYLRELMLRLAARGHHVEVYTTRSQRMIQTPFNYLVWDNFLPAGEEEDEGVRVRRFEVRNPRPRRARRIVDSILAMQERERESPVFSALMEEAVAGTEEHCFLCGWHEPERWEDGPARWTRRSATLVLGGEDLEGVVVEAYPYMDTNLQVEVSGEGSWEFELSMGRTRELRVAFGTRLSAVVRFTVSRTARPAGDVREVGLAVRRVTALAGGRECELELERGWREFLDTARESALARVLWGAAERRPPRASRHHRYIMGPRSPRLEREVMAAARGCDVVLGAMVPMSTLDLAWRAARAYDKPFVAFPLFHTRDPNHYWDHFRKALEGAAGVEANSVAVEELMREWGLSSFAVGPGYDLEEFASPHIDGRRFRERFGFGSRPLLLWVGRKNEYKGYRAAMAALRLVREKAPEAALVMIGPDEDNLPVSQDGVYYLGAQPRSTLLDAYDACDALLFPSLHESFCMVFGEAWLRGKPVLGNACCAAARGIIEHGVDGYLCREVEEYAQRVLELIVDPALARRMGERGREKMLATRGWDLLVERLEEKLREIAGGDRERV
ncbi:MAG: glycosyltransferase [Actinomycetota bacterium]|nr:glycosyltransferase [Actinomycetota bacterium]